MNHEEAFRWLLENSSWQEPEVASEMFRILNKALAALETIPPEEVYNKRHGAGLTNQSFYTWLRAGDWSINPLACNLCAGMQGIEHLGDPCQLCDDGIYLRVDFDPKALEIEDLKVMQTLPLSPDQTNWTEEARETVKSLKACYVTAVQEKEELRRTVVTRFGQQRCKEPGCNKPLSLQDSATWAFGCQGYAEESDDPNSLLYEPGRGFGDMHYSRSFTHLRTHGAFSSDFDHWAESLRLPSDDS